MSITLERPATTIADPTARRFARLTPTDVERAADVQHALSTAHAVTLGHVSAASEVRGLHGAGGDFADLIATEGQLVAVLGDVSGKGAPASLIAAVVLGSVQHHVTHLGPRPGAVLSAVCASVRAMLDRTDALVTLAIVAIDPAGGALRYSSAGHHPIVLATGSAPTALSVTCPPLGALQACSSERQIAFPPSSALILASDGYTEQPDPRGVEFGVGGLLALAEEARAGTPAVALERAAEVVDAHARGTHTVDDRAMIVVTAGNPW